MSTSKNIRLLILKFLKIFFEKNYSKVIFGIFFITSCAYLLMLLFGIPLKRELFIISLLTLVLVLRNDFYWWLYKLGFFLENSLKKLINYNLIYNNAEMKDIILNIVNAIFLLKDSKTGALITFERQSSLIDYYQSAVQLNSDISEEIILSIFNSKSPLHDGGLIISNHKIKSAGCFYPISKNKTLTSDLGSRHRAALGLSEITDSITVLVSEEKGKVFLIQNGIISNSIDKKAELFDLLVDVLS